MTKIGLIDYGAGNVHSVYKALRYVGAEVEWIRGPEELRRQDAVVLPGVGAFDDCVRALRFQGLTEELLRFIEAGRPFLGICIGYQILFESSDEFQSVESGLGIFRGKVIRFPEQPDLKVPQIGWNQIEIVRPDCPLFDGIPQGSHVYFVHSYYPKPKDPSIVATWTEYGVRYPSAVWRENVFATQFHPEKSQYVGLRILANFVRFARNGNSL